MTVDPSSLAGVLDHHEIAILGRIEWSSNATFLVEISDPDHNEAPVRGIYKPERGERPLGDFPPGIWKREVAAYLLSDALGWDVVPETVPVDGPIGAGSLQRFIDVDYRHHYFTMFDEAEPAVLAQLKRICCFDLIANNTDRKSGHCLLDDNAHVWAIDNALCFHSDFKLRTVIWDFAGTPIDAVLIEDLHGLSERGLPEQLSEYLDGDELAALSDRIGDVTRGARFPHDPTGRRYPWPLV